MVGTSGSSARNSSTSNTPSRGILVVGQVARDLVLEVERIPDAGGSTTVRTRHELLGGKGANQAVGMAQLGAPVALLGVVGADDVGARLLRSAQDDGLDTGGVARRGTSALLVDVVDADGERRLLEHHPEGSPLTTEDVHRARDVVRAADTVCLQLQQPAAALAEAARLAAGAGARIVLDGAAEGPAMDELLDRAGIVRADAHEARLITGADLDGVDSAVAAARGLLDRGVEVVAFGIGGGDVVVWAGGHRFFPFGEDEENVVDRTGAGDAFLAGLVVGLRAGWAPDRAGRLAADCASSTVQRLGGRPDLTALRPA